MATTTPNIGLTLPIGGENVSRQIINDNNTIIDSKMGAVPVGQNLQGEIASLSDQIANANRATITSRLSSSYGTIAAYESCIGDLCAVAITFTCTTAIAKNATFMTGLKASQVNRAPVVPMFNTDDGKLYHANVSSSGELTAHTEALPTGSYRMSFAYVT